MFKKALYFVVAIAMSATIALPSNVFASGLYSSSAVVSSRTGLIQNGGIIIDDGRPPTVSDDLTYPSITPVNPSTQPSGKEIYDAIKLIEASYLHRNTDGTFSIDQAAGQVIKQEVLGQVTNGMKETNHAISQGILTSRSDMSVVETTPSYTNEVQASSNVIQDSYSYKGINKVVWRWYGKDVYANANACANLKWIFYRVAAVGGGAAMFFTFFCGPFTLPLGLYAVDAELMAITIDQGSTRSGAVIQCVGYRNYSVPFWAHLQ